MIVKVHKADTKKIVTIVDSDLIGKKFEEKNLQLDLTVDFYKGEERTEEEIKDITKDAYIVHLVGEESINFGLKMGWLDKDNIIKIKNIPHAETMFITD